jgi:hypothetical protein
VGAEGGSSKLSDPGGEDTNRASINVAFHGHPKLEIV